MVPVRQSYQIVGPRALSLDRSQAKCLPFLVDGKGPMGLTLKVDSLF